VFCVMQGDFFFVSCAIQRDLLLCVLFGTESLVALYGVASIGRLLENISLFCRIYSLL